MVFLTVIPLMCLLAVVNGYVGTTLVPNVNGKCEINGKLYSSGDVYHNEERCERWICRANSAPISYSLHEDGTFEAGYETKARVEVTGCGLQSVIKEDGKRCRVLSTTGKYPDCCNGPLDCE
uniref:Single domain-containing protein n=1 Tax=Isometrus maculatus TaxID=497827 RepID=A0A0U1SEV4_ISOMC|nr:hypothetical protein [Isometrus maculatus]